MEISLVKSEEELALCLALRRTVFVEEQNVPEELENDGKDGECHHVLAKIDGKPMGTARFLQIGDAVKVQRVCVPKAARGTGIGAAVMETIIQTVRRDGQAVSVQLSSQQSAIPFYERLGFEAYGEAYLDAGIPHRDMVLAL